MGLVALFTRGGEVLEGDLVGGTGGKGALCRCSGLGANPAAGSSGCLPITRGSLCGMALNDLGRVDD